MTESLREELRQFLLPNVRLTGRRLGAGAYGSVEEVAIPGALCAAKKIHEVFLDRTQIPEEDIQRATRQFVTECRLMSTMRHPHIVQFLGVCFLDGSRLPALVMERLLTSLHDLLEPDGTQQNETKPYFPLALKCSILYDAASGLAFLHGLIPPVIHRDLFARNVLVNSAVVAKIADLGMARILPDLRVATMTKAPGAGIYMPPEALEAKSEEEENSSRYDVAIDIFSLGVVGLFTVSQTFPCNLLAPTYTINTSRMLVARTELERRETYMRKVYSQLPENHPLIEMIKRCLKNAPEDRPSIQQVLQLLEQARAEIGANESDLNKLELVQTLKEERDRQTSRNPREVAELQDQLELKEREKESLVEQLERKQEELEIERIMKERKSEEMERKQLELVSKERQLSQAQSTSSQLQAQVQTQQQELESRKRELGELQQKLCSNETLLADFQRNLQRERELGEIRSKGTGGAQAPPTPTARTLDSISPRQPQAPPRPIPRALKTVPPPPKKLKLQCHKLKRAPQGMRRGSAAAEQNFTYFRPLGENEVYLYTISTDEWLKLPTCPHSSSALVIIHNELTAVGGYSGGNYTNKLFTLHSLVKAASLSSTRSSRA